MITEGDPDVLAFQRAENYATVLLGDRDWANRERAAARARCNELHRNAVEVAKRGKVDPPPPPSEIQIAKEVGRALAWQCFGIARGVATGMKEIEELLAANAKGKG